MRPLLCFLLLLSACGQEALSEQDECEERGGVYHAERQECFGASDDVESPTPSAAETSSPSPAQTPLGGDVPPDCDDLTQAHDSQQTEYARSLLPRSHHDAAVVSELIDEMIGLCDDVPGYVSAYPAWAQLVDTDARFGGSPPTPTPTPTPEPTPTPTPTPEPTPMGWDARLAAAENIPYDDLFRNSDDHLGKEVYFRGEVIQVLGDAGLWNLRVNVTPGEYGFWDDTVFIEFYGDQRYLDDDIIDFVGTFTGPHTYESVMGGQITIPGILILEDEGIRLAQ